MCQQQNKNTLKSFTLMEILIAMVISTVVIGATIAVWLSVEGMFKQGISDSYSDTGCMVFLMTLEKDLNKCDNISTENEVVRFSFVDAPEIVYDFDKTFVTRTIFENTDTFMVKTSDLICTQHKIFPNVVQNISFSIHLNGKSIPLFFTKKYSNDRIFNFEAPPK